MIFAWLFPQTLTTLDPGMYCCWRESLIEGRHWSVHGSPGQKWKSIEFFTISPKYMDANIANFVLAVAIKIKKTNKICNLEK